MSKSTAIPEPRLPRLAEPEPVSPDGMLLRAIFGTGADKVAALKTLGREAPTGKRPGKALPPVTDVKFVEAFRAAPIDRVRLIKRGVSAKVLDQLAKDMLIPKERLAETLGLARATIDRKAREDKPLSSDEGSRVLGMASLIGQVQTMIEESGNPEGFNAAEWVGRWINRPLPALSGQKPAELMDTPDGQALVSSIVARMQSGAYS